MSQAPVSPVVLVILDGWGYREEHTNNSIAAADTPVMDSLWNAYPRTTIRTSGKDVGLPMGQMGNSEVGHLNLGSGRVVPQELVRISDAIEEGTIRDNPAIQKISQTTKTSGGKLHLIGLCSDGGVHSHVDHLLGLIDWAKAEALNRSAFMPLPMVEIPILIRGVPLFARFKLISTRWAWGRLSRSVVATMLWIETTAGIAWKKPIEC